MKKIVTLIVLFVFVMRVDPATYRNNVSYTQPDAGQLIIYINSDTNFGETASAEVHWGASSYLKKNGVFGSYLGGTANWMVTYTSGDGLPTSGSMTYQLFNLNESSAEYGHTGFIFTVSDMALPVELTSFSALIKYKSVNLVWKTVTEMNNYGYEIQRSANNGSFTKVGFVNGSGTSNSTKEYSFTDKTATSGKYTYRLKQIDNDGNYEYSKEVEVDLGKPTSFVLNQNYPNPFNPTTVISYQLPVNSYVTLKVYNAIGTEVTTLVNGYKEAGSYNYELGSANGGRNYEMSSGIYFYTLRAGDFVQTKKMILLK